MIVNNQIYYKALYNNIINIFSFSKKDSNDFNSNEEQNENLRDNFLKKPNELVPSLRQPSIVIN